MELCVFYVFLLLLAQLVFLFVMLDKSFTLGIQKRTILFEFSVGDEVYLIASPVTCAEALEHC